MNDLITKIPVGPTLNEKRKVRKEKKVTVEEDGKLGDR